MPLTEYADIAAQNLGWLIAIGLAVCLILFFTFTVSRRLFHIQKELGQLSEDVAALRLAEERRFFAELKQGRGEGAERQESRPMSARDAPRLFMATD
jgi:hypothetical protein